MNSLDLDLNLIGRRTKAVTATVLREVEESDLALLATERGIQPTRLQRLRDSHHALARLCAAGLAGHDISLMTGYTESRISILRSDPAFEELVEFYRGNDREATADLTARLLNVALDATQELHERLHDQAEAVSTDQLLDVIKLTADRTGHGPKTTNVNLNIDLSERIRAARQRIVQVSSAPALVPGVAVPESLPAPTNKEPVND